MRILNFFVLVLLCLFIRVNAADFKVNGIYYNVIDSISMKVEVAPPDSVKSNGWGEYMGEIMIPTKVTYNNKDYEVVRIASNCFYYENVEKLYIGESIRFLGGCYIRRMSNIIGEYKYTKIEIDSKNPYLLCLNGSVYSKDKTKLYSYKENKKKVKIPSHVKIIGAGAFSACKKVEEVVIPESVEVIESQAFASCKNLKNVVIKGESLKDIGDWAFAGCEQLKYFVPVNYEKYFKEMFDGRRHYYNEIVLPNSVEKLGEYAFFGISDKYISWRISLSKSLKEFGEQAIPTDIHAVIVIPEENVNFKVVDKFSLLNYDKTEYLGFYGNHYTGCVIPNTVKKIRDRAFDEREFIDLVIPKSVSEFGTLIYNKYIVLEVEDGNPVYATKDGVLFNSDMTELIKDQSPKGRKSYIVPNTVKVIKEHAFERSELETLVISDSVEVIGALAFASSVRLKDLKLGNSLKVIGDYAFVANVNLQEVVFPSSVEYVGLGAFASCSKLNIITISSPQIKFNEQAFYDTPLKQLIKKY